MKNLPKIYVPPMAAVTDLVFRRLLRHILGDYAKDVLLATEMVSSKGMMYEDNPERLRLEPEEKNKVLIQLFGHEPETMAKAAIIAEQEGALGIDINMGCPVPKITKGKDGAALMKEPELAIQIVKQVKAAVSIPVSVKTRLGWCVQSKNILEFAKKLEDAGIRFLTIHGRFRSQMYSGIADWDSIREVREKLSIPVFVNGDINNPEKSQEAIDLTGCHGVAIARAVIGNPWMILHTAKYLAGEKKISEPDILEKVKILKLHLNWAYEDKGTNGLQTLKKHIGKYISGFKNAAVWRNDIVSTHNYEDMNNILNKLEESIYV